METTLRIETTVLPGHRLEVSDPKSPDGAKVEVIVVWPEKAPGQFGSALEFLESLPAGPRAFKWEEYEKAPARGKRSVGTFALSRTPDCCSLMLECAHDRKTPYIGESRAGSLVSRGGHLHARDSPIRAPGYAQVKSYLKATGLHVGLLLNLNSPTLVAKRVVL